MHTKVTRINVYDDLRFPDKVLRQHGAFLVNDTLPYGVEIISDTEAMIRGEPQYRQAVIEEFRFYAEHISKFYDEQGSCVAEYEPVVLFDVCLSEIQPSQFFVDREKKAAVSEFIHMPTDVVVPLIRHGDRYVSLDGHTRLSVAVDLGFGSVRGFLTQSDNWVYAFVEEANHRGVLTPYDMKELSHAEYKVQWDQFCSDFFKKADREEDLD